MTCATRLAFAFLCIVPLAYAPAFGQKDKKGISAPVVLLTRTTPRHETHRLPYGGTLTVVGAPEGSIIIEGWQRSEVEITAEIKLTGPTEADLDRLAMVNNFAIDVDSNHIRILTTGAHDKKFLKQVAKDFPKNLIGLPWKIDFRIKVPALIDLDISLGKGPITLSGVEGNIRLNALISDAALSLTGGSVSALIQNGSIAVKIPTRGWHGQGADIKMASGKLTVELATGFSGDIDASIMRAGEIKSSYPNLGPRALSSITQKSMRARAGSGGATLSFTVGDGVIEFSSIGEK